MAKKEKCEITKVAVSIGGEEKLITVEQAKSLKRALEELFGSKVVREEHHHHHRDRYWWSGPILDSGVTKFESAPKREDFMIWCQSENNTAALSIQ